MDSKKKSDTVILYGNFETVYEKVKKDYVDGDVELLTYLETTKTPDLTIEESYKLYAKLRSEIDGDIVLRLTSDEVVDESKEYTFKLDYWLKNVGDIYGR